MLPRRPAGAREATVELITKEKGMHFLTEGGTLESCQGGIDETQCKNNHFAGHRWSAHTVQRGSHGPEANLEPTGPAGSNQPARPDDPATGSYRPNGTDGQHGRDE